MTVTHTVLVPTYNRPALLREALVSLVGQDGDAEVLVLNDGGDPPDLTGLRLRCRLLNLPHVGQSAALNAGLAEARGRYVTVAQDDDLVLPGKLEALGSVLDATPATVGAVYSLPLYTDAAGNPLTTPPRLIHYLAAHPTVTWATIRASGLFIHGTATMYRRVALEAVGGWDAALQTAEEYDLHLRLLKAGFAFRGVNAVTVTYRRHVGGKSQDRFRRRRLRAGVMAGIYARLGLRDVAADER